MWDAGFEQIAQAPEVQNAIRMILPQARSQAAREGLTPIGNPFVVDPATGRMTLRTLPNGEVAKPNLEFWDQVKRQLDRGDWSSREWSRTLRGHIDQLVPEYGTARQGAASFFGAQNALEAGQNYVVQRLANRETRQALAQMTGQQRQLFQDGFIDRLIQEVRARRTPLGYFQENPMMSEKMEIALGPQRAHELEAMLRVERLMNMSREAVRGNSTTARQLMELGLAGGVGLGESNMNPLSLAANPQALLHTALVYGALRGHRVIDQNVARQVATLLASGDTQRLANGARLLSRNNGLFGSLRDADAAMAIAARGSAPALTP
jgi:hypothetical protein